MAHDPAHHRGAVLPAEEVGRGQRAVSGDDPAVVVDEVVAAADESDAGFRLHHRDLALEGLRLDQVVGVEQLHQRGAGRAHRRVEVVDHRQGLGVPHHPQTGVVVAIHDLDRAVSAGVVEHHELEVSEGLGEDAVDGPSDVVGLLVEGDSDGDAGAPVAGTGRP